MLEEPLLAVAVILGAGVVAQWVALRLHLPAILLLLATGLALGAGLQWLHPDDVFGSLLLPFVSVAVALILFEGGLSLNLRELSKTGSVIRNLVTVGAAVTMGLTALAAWAILDFPPALAVMLGAILSVTGPTVIGPLLDHVRPTKRVASVLKWEGILIDPIGAMLAVLVLEVALLTDIGEAPGVIANGVAMTLLVGFGVGLAAAGLIMVLFRYYLAPDALHSALSLAMVVGAFEVANQLHHEAGLFAVTIMGIALATQPSPAVRRITEFKENLRGPLISGLFIVLGARLHRWDLAILGPSVALFVLALVFVVRPLAVAASTVGSELGKRERAFIAWLAPRGIVAAAVGSIFAIRLEEAGIPDSVRLVPVTFAVIAGTILIYGTTAGWVARKLRIASPPRKGVLIVGAHPLARAIGRTIKAEGRRVVVADTVYANISAARMDELDTFYGNVLSEAAEHELDLTGVGYLLAMTPNDEVNALSVQRFAHEFGRRNVYQIKPTPHRAGDKHRFASWIRGRLIGSEVGYTELDAYLTDGGSVKRTKLTPAFRFDDFVRQHGDRAIPLLLLDPKGDLRAFAEESPPSPKPGQTVIALVRNGSEPEKAPEAEATV